MYILFAATVINRFGDFVMPFLTMYLTIKIGLSFEITGIIVTISSLIGIPASILGGKLADEFGRKTIYLISQGGAAAALLPCAFLKNPAPIVVFLLISTFFSGAVHPSLNAVITDILPPDQRQKGFSLQYLGINIGVAVGPIVAGFLFNNFLPMLFIGDAVTSFIAIYMVWINIKETNTENTKQTVHSEKEEEEKGSTISALLKRPQIVMFLIVYILYSFVYTQHRFSLPLTANVVFGSTGASKYGFLISINALTVVFFTVAMTSLTKKLKPLTIITIAGLVYAVGFGMIGNIHSYYMFMVSTVIWSLGEILVMTNFGVYIADNSPSNFRARFNAISSLSWAMGTALGTSVAGKFIQEIGLNYIWTLTFILSIVGTIGMFGILVFERWKEKDAGGKIFSQNFNRQ